MWSRLGWLMILAVILSVVGLNHDWPLVYGIEGQQVAASVRFAYAPQFEHFCCLTYPPLYFYLMALIYRSVAVIETALKIVPDWEGWMLKILIDPFEATLIARGVSLLGFWLTLWGGYKTAKLLSGKTAGLLTVLAMLVTPSLVVFSKMGQSEMVMVGLITWSLFFSIKLLRGSGSWRDLLLTSFLAGLAISIKYNALPVVIPILIYLALRRSVREWLVAGVSISAVVLLSHPFMLRLILSRYFFDLLRINPSYALERLIPEPMSALASALRAGDFEKQRHGNTLLWTWELIKNHEGLVAWLMLGGTLVSLVKPNKVKAALFLTVLGQLVLVSLLGGLDNEFHYLLPLYPAGLILVGVSLSRVKGWLLVLAVLCWSWWLLLPLLNSQLELAKPGTEVVVKEWLMRNLREGQVVVRGHNSPLKLTHPEDSIILPPDSLSEALQKQIGDYVASNPLPREEVFRFDYPEADWPADWDEGRIKQAKEESFIERLFRFGYWSVDELIVKKVKYVVLGSYELEEAYKPSWQLPGSDLDILYRRGQSAYRDFLEDSRVSEVYKVVADERHRGPELRVYRIRDF